MPILGTQASGFFEPPAYSLAQTFNTSDNYTIPAGKTRLALIGVSGGGGGGSSPGTVRGSGGGGGGGVFSVREISVTPGETYAVLIGAAGNGNSTQLDTSNSGGTTSFGNIVVANGGQGGAAGQSLANSGSEGGAGGTVTINTGTVVLSETGGAGGVRTAHVVFNGSGNSTGPTGGAAGNNTLVTSGDANITGFSTVLSGGGGGGGGGSVRNQTGTATSGAGGAKGNFAGANGSNSSVAGNSSGSNGNANSVNGRGGGGSGASGISGNDGNAYYSGDFFNNPGVIGGAGGAGILYVYVK